MINIHCTKKLFNALSLDESRQLKPKIRAEMIEQRPQNETSALDNWHAHYFTIERSPCLFLLHDETRFPLFIPNIKKADLRDMDYFFNDALMNTIMKLGADDQLMDSAHSMIQPLCFDTDCDRSVQATMNRMLREIKYHLADMNVRDLLGYSINVHFSDSPCSVYKGKKTIWPKREFMDLLKSVTK